MISENDEDDLAPKLGEDRMPPKIRKWWMYCKIEVMKDAVMGNREVAPRLEEHPRMVCPGIRLEKSSDRLGMFFFPSRFALWGSK